MRFTSRQPAVSGGPGVSGTIRSDRRTSSLLRRLQRGDIAVIDHLDLDRATASALVECGVVGVVNAVPFISGRYPNLGPELLARSGVLMLDDVGPEVFATVADGGRGRLAGAALWLGEQQVATGTAMGADEVATAMEQARTGLATQLQSFTHNTTEFLRREQELLLHGQGVPPLVTPIKGRATVVVVRGYDYREDLRRLRRFIREQRPVLIGVDSGADVLLSMRLRPDIVVVGEHGLAQSGSGRESSDAVTDKALRSAREVVLHTDRSGRAIGSDRLERLGVRSSKLAASGTVEDVSLLLADVSGASLIITVGTHATLDEFLDRQRSGLASTFLTRLRVGPKLVDAKGVPPLYSGRVRVWHLLLVLLAGMLAFLVALAATPVGQGWAHSLGTAVAGLFASIQGQVS